MPIKKEEIIVKETKSNPFTQKLQETDYSSYLHCPLQSDTYLQGKQYSTVFSSFILSFI